MHQDEKSESPAVPNANMEEDKSISTLYRMELSKGYFNSKKEIQATSFPLSDSNQSSPIENTSEQEKTFDAWKSRNRVFNQSQGEEETLDMVSNLGRSLENWQHMIPNSSPYCDYSESNMMSRHKLQRRSNQPFYEPNTFVQRRDYHPLILYNNPDQYLGHGNDAHAVNFCGNGNIQSRTVNEMLNTPPVSRQKVEISKQNLRCSPNIKENYLRESFLFSPYCQPMNCSSHINPHSNNKSDGHMRDHFYCNQSNYPCCKFKENYDACGNTKHRKSNKNENLNKHISDLYKIVYLQNQQLELLQKQVKKLIEINLKDKSHPTNREGATIVNKKYKGTKEKRTFNLAVIKENENLEKKVSVGIMTSFIENSFAKISSDKELKITPKSKKKSISSTDDHESSTETTSDEEENSNNCRDGDERNNISFTLNDVTVPEDNPPSPQTSFHIDMQEYKTSSESESDSDSSSSASDEKSSQQLGWTFYDKVVGKVNDMLQISVDNEEKDPQEDDVRNATLDHLRQLGVSFVEPESPVTKRVTFNNRNSRAKLTNRQQLQCDSETSLHMNALANKYLKNEQHNESSPVDCQVQKLNCQNNLSQATLRYLERYQLSPNENKRDNGEHQEKVNKKKKKKKEVLKGLEKGANTRHSKCGKILDITAIKKQPKLLPKNTQL